MRRALQLPARAVVTVGLSGAAVGLAATPALAASGSLTVNPSGTVDHNVVIKASGSYDNSTGTSSQSLQLSVTRPDSSSVVLYKGSAGPLSQGSTPSESVDTSALNVNGDYVFTFSVGGSSTSKTVTLRVPPATVSGFSGSASGTVGHFTWSPNGEPDLAAYDIVDVTDSGNPRDLTPGGVGTNVCDGNGCSVDIDFGSSAQGTSRTFVIDALRYTSPSHSSTISSGDSPPTTVAFPAPPPPSNTGGGSGSSGGGGPSGGSSGGGASGTGPSGGSGSGGSSGGATSGGTTARGGAHRGISSKHANVALKAYLPSFTAGAAPDLPSVVTEVKPLPEGTYQPTLAYPDQVVSEAVHKHGADNAAAVRNEIVRVLNVSALWKSLAGAALVLLVAAHLRAWVVGVESEQ